MASDYYVYCKVSKIIREFVIATNNGSDLLSLDKGSILSKIIKANLSKSVKYDKPPDEQNRIRIQLNYYKPEDPRVYNYLSLEGQRKVERYIKQEFKKTFHLFVAGYYSASGSQQDGIYDFCHLFKLDPDKLGFDMLKKSWDRSEAKEMVKNFSTFCPLKK